MVIENSGRLKLQGLLGDYRWASALRQGVETSDYQLDFDNVGEASSRFKAFIREGAYQVGELAIVTHLQALSYGRDYVLLPIVILGNHHHKSIASCREGCPLTPATMAGKRVGVRTYSQTTGVWARGFLQHDYGVDLDSVTWVTFEDAHLPEYQDPPNCQRAPEGRKIVEMFTSGALDGAILGMAMPDDPRVRSVIDDPAAVAKAWEDRHGIVPINHMFVAERSLCEEKPEVVRDIYQRLVAARGSDDRRFPVGLDADWSGLDLVAQFAFEQRVIPRKFTASELFSDAERLLKL